MFDYNIADEINRLTNELNELEVAKKEFKKEKADIFDKVLVWVTYTNRRREINAKIRKLNAKIN